MLKGIQLLRNVGQFDNAQTPTQPPFGRLTLLYAENGRGKTTLAAVLRSLAQNDPSIILQRHRLKATNPPHVVIPLATGGIAQFQNGQWSGSVPDIAVFDDEFVAQNVCSGIEIASEHRQNLHELIIGGQGVALNAALQKQVDAIEEHNRQIKANGDAIPSADRHGLTIDAFCALPQNANIDATILAAEQAVAAAKAAEAVRNRGGLQAPSLPAMPLDDVRTLLATGVDGLNAEAARRVQEHLARLGKGGEQWVAEGVARITDAGEPCPFCQQPLSDADIIKHYQSFFSEAYAALRARIADQIRAFERAHGGDTPAAFERAVREYLQGADFWRQFAAVPEIVLDTAAIARVWKDARDGVLAALRTKQAAPLDPAILTDGALKAAADYEGERTDLHAQAAVAVSVNTAIDRVKEAAATANLATLEADLRQLKAQKARHATAIAALCQAYLDEKAAKAVTEKARVAARAALDHYRTSIFPAYETAINAYLKAFNAGFRLESVSAVNIRGGSTANYTVLIDQAPVPLTSDGSGPSFRTAMSAGDRNTLALAFFFAALDADVGLSSKIVVIDDPMTSLDEHRTLATRHQIQALLGRVAQVVVLSHSKAFLCALWENTQKSTCTPLKIARAASGSAFQAWDVRADCVSEHDKRHELVGAYIAAVPKTDERAVAQALRYILEAFVRVAYPGQLAAGEALGKAFIKTCTQAQTNGAPIMMQADLTELQQLLDFAHRYHHDTNPAYQTEAINDQELLDFARRTIAFARRHV